MSIEELGENAAACLGEIGAVLRKYGVRLVSDSPCLLEFRHLNSKGMDGEFLNLIFRDRIDIDRQSRGLVITCVLSDGITTKDGAA